jgi:hypothetical protein
MNHSSKFKPRHFVILEGSISIHMELLNVKNKINDNQIKVYD